MNSLHLIVDRNTCPAANSWDPAPMEDRLLSYVTILAVMTCLGIYLFIYSYTDLATKATQYLNSYKISEKPYTAG